MKNTFLPELKTYISTLNFDNISAERKDILQLLIHYIQDCTNNQKAINLNFICTHNSRRSQLSQIWAHTAAAFYDVPAQCFSGGVEVTAFNERAVAAINRCGFDIKSEGNVNPKYLISYATNAAPILAFSKLFDDPVNHVTYFAAVMTCSHADDNCPHIPNTDQRLAVRYEDPKEFDDSPQEAEMYDARCLQIATELFYVFHSVINAKKS